MHPQQPAARKRRGQHGGLLAAVGAVRSGQRSRQGVGRPATACRGGAGGLARELGGELPRGLPRVLERDHALSGGEGGDVPARPAVLEADVPHPSSLQEDQQG